MAITQASEEAILQAGYEDTRHLLNQVEGKDKIIVGEMAVKACRESLVGLQLYMMNNDDMLGTLPNTDDVDVQTVEDLEAIWDSLDTLIDSMKQQNGEI